ncbi:MaoC family dehydratase [Azospirillum sp. TSO35-2]|uniref:MaoC family dehydratase n=1 Tax=Azospirillum sp. TSO35-2 TaxID=716796 RepID=UPI000D607A45|nr:MaoC family dehydratase [Azospirillum sp. TSO35-2]PWC33155.1 dehydratase [Azospirillum sp. TSO35-2]
MRYFDDVSVGDRFQGGPLEVSEAEIIAYAERFDPQPFHLDPQAAKDTLFRGLAASGWHTAGMTMRMIVGSNAELAGGYVGMGVDSIAWPKPTRPGDVLRIEMEVLDARRSAKRPDQGVLRVKTTTLDQADEVVQVMVANLLAPARPAS